MTGHEAFLQAILEDTEDDVARLVYADWLDEQGGPRGEFIRAQVRMHQVSPDSPRWRALYERQEQLIVSSRWLAGLPSLPGVSWGRFERGFVRLVYFSNWEAFRANAEGAFAAA